MPIYEYQCSACGHHLEAVQKMTDSPLSECPKCHAATLNKLISASQFQLKGSGWYATDYKPAKTESDKSGDKSGETKEKSMTTDKPSEKTPDKGSSGGQSSSSNSTAAQS